MVTIEQIIDLNPCYSRERIEELMRLDPYEALCSIPAADARWLLSRLLPPKDRIDWAKACARRAHEYAATAAHEARAEDAAASAWAAAMVAQDAAWAAERAARSARAAEDAAERAARAAAWAARAARAAEDAEEAAAEAARAEHNIAIRHALSLLGAGHNG